MKRLLISLLICSSYLINCPAQTPSSDTLSETVYEWAEVMPEVEGGSQALLKALSKGLHHASTASNINGSKIIISFVVTAQGQIADIQVIKNPFGNDVLEQLTKVIKSLKWHPGRQNGKPVAVRYKHSAIICFD